MGSFVGGSKETLPEHLNVGSGVVEGWGSTGLVLEIWREGRLSSCGDHGGREAMGFMNHGVQSQHNARNLFHPCPGGRTIKQASSEHIVDGPMALLVDGVALWVVEVSSRCTPKERISFPQISPTNSRPLSDKRRRGVPK